MFYADLHVHSRFSRATSRDCDLEHLALWAAKKGIAVVATGDFTHPEWFAQIEQQLTPAEPGLFRLRQEPPREICQNAVRLAPGDVRFMLQVEISTIYKKDGRTRKVHHLIYAPSLDAAREVTQRLARIGNLASDGRPILGLDSRHLLEIALESGPGCCLVPAHVWTPWFAVLGSQSGFDSIDECYDDLAGEIFALETGLSSDPAMNWRVSGLDRYALISNSDAHSPPKLGREACVFDTDRDYFAMFRALRTGEGYGGTVEFFPEEGKYHFDGHRKCGVCLAPDETLRYGGNCPVCGKPMTLGVMYRVHQLADRESIPEPLPARAAPFRSLIPLEEILSEVSGVGPQSSTVQRRYEDLLARLGPELEILDRIPPEDISRAASPLVAEGIVRMREGRVTRQAGFDGQYGTIRLFSEDELRRQTAVGLLFQPEERKEPSPDVAQPPPAVPGSSAQAKKAAPENSAQPGAAVPQGARRGSPDPADLLARLDPEQRSAAEAVHGPLLIVAGPGTGKTRTLTHRIAHLVSDGGVAPEQCLALTFSRRAAAEMVERLDRLLPGRADRVPVMTFHALGLTMLREQGEKLGLPSSWRVAGDLERSAMLAQAMSLSATKARQTLEGISRHKRPEHPGRTGFQPVPDGLESRPTNREALEIYRREMAKRAWLDFDDLIAMPLQLLKTSQEVLDSYRSRFRWISVDEFQDIDAGQYELLRLLAPADANLCVIGDPDQAIYGFRGADPLSFQHFRDDYPAARTIVLTRNYRSTQTIVDAALQAIAPSTLIGQRRLDAAGAGPEQIEVHACTTDRAEAEFVVHTIERMLGGWSFFSLDSRRAEAHEGQSLSFADFAVLYRTEAQSDVLAEALERSGIPFQRRSHDRLVEQPAVQAILDRLVALPQGTVAGGGVPVPVSGPDAPLVELLNRAIEQTKEAGPAPPSSLEALRSLAAQHKHDLPQFLSELALGVDVDWWDPRADRVSLLTLHAAKGLEFPVVFLVGCEDGLIPLHWGELDEASEAEERRLLFVGMTRARHRLILTHARKRRLKGPPRPSIVSPFLDDMERAILAFHEHRAIKKPPAPDRQRTLFEGP